MTQPVTLHLPQVKAMTSEAQPRVRRWVMGLGLGLLLGAHLVLAREDPAVIGAGATFPGPLYQAWALEFKRSHHVAVRYDLVGSGEGLERLERGSADFGASDVPLSAAQLSAAGLLQFPAVIGGVLPVINIRGIRPGELKLSGEVLADIYLGRVRRWDDAAIRVFNPQLHLPHANITVVHRAEASGSSLLYSRYLSASNPRWSAAVGVSSTPSWPVGVGARGNEGVATLVQRTRFAIGYVEFYFARAHGLSDVTLRNHDGRFVRARPENFAAAAQTAQWGDLAAIGQLPSDPPGELSWPISGASFILVPQVARDAERARAVFRFFAWALEDGADLVEQLDYVPIPHSVVGQLPQLWHSARDTAGHALWP